MSQKNAREIFKILEELRQLKINDIDEFNDDEGSNLMSTLMKEYDKFVKNRVMEMEQGTRSIIGLLNPNN